MTTKDYPVSWHDIHRISKALAWKLEAKGPWKGIIAITRGGLVPACLVAMELNVRQIDTLSAASYDEKSQGDLKILKKPADNVGDGDGWLIIDDLVDTGQTFKVARTLYPKAYYACLYAKPLGMPTTDTFVTELSQDTWIYFPWDDKSFPDHIRAQIGKHLD